MNKEQFIEAIKSMTVLELADLVKGAEVLQPETGCKPRVYYRNIPGQFIGATLYDPQEEEVVIGATCRLNCGAKVWSTVSDEFGDFWFRDLPVGKFDLVIECPGYATKTFTGLDTTQCVNLGDIPLEKA